jgi:hypothetical protein
MLMQFGTYPGTGRALGRGIVCGFGADTICSAGTDLFSEMRLALAAERSRANAAVLARGERVGRSISISVTCCGSPPSMELVCGASTTRLGV